MVVHAATWLLVPPGYNLVYKLMDLGYDVWLYNQRGKPTSNGHVSLQPEDPEYWNWGPDELGYYDVPNTIDYVLKVTEKKKLSLIGHSLGCAVSFMALTNRPEYNAKNLHALANSELLIGINADGLLLSNTSVGEERRAASIPLAKILGFDVSSTEMNEASNYRSLTINNGRNSRKVFMHVVQKGDSWRFAKFDYGEQKNLQVYKSKIPPLHDFTKLKVPIHIFYSLGDKDVLPEQIASYCKKFKDLKKDVQCIEIQDMDFGHSDFVANVQAKDLVFEKAIAILNKK